MTEEFSIKDAINHIMKLQQTQGEVLGELKKTNSNIENLKYTLRKDIEGAMFYSKGIDKSLKKYQDYTDEKIEKIESRLGDLEDDKKFKKRLTRYINSPLAGWGLVFITALNISVGGAHLYLWDLKDAQHLHKMLDS